MRKPLFQTTAQNPIIKISPVEEEGEKWNNIGIENESLTCVSAVIAVGLRRAHDVLFNGVEGDKEFPGVVHKEGTPSGHSFDNDVMKLSAFLKENPDIVAEGALGVDGATRVAERVKAVKLWPSLPLLTDLENWDRHGFQSLV